MALLNFRAPIGCIKASFQNPKVRQAGGLYAALIASLVLGIVVSVINTRLLGPKAFGDFKFLQTIWTVGVLCITFGFLTTGGILLAEHKTAETERALMGSLLAIAAAISLAFIALAIAASFPLAHLYGDELSERIRRYAGLLFVFPLQIYLQEALRGTNDIHSLSLLNVLPQLAFIPAALAVNHFYGFSLDTALLLYLLSMAATVLFIIFRVKPKFSFVQCGIREVLRHNRAIGWHIYAATLITTSTAYLGQFTLAYFMNTTQVGVFALALTITMPLTMVPNVIATTFFKHFATLNRIPQKVINASTLLSILTLIAFLLAINTLIVLLYTERFIAVVPLAYICAVGSVLHGMGDVFNRFLLANGRTRMLRSNAIHLGVISILGYIFLVAEYGAMGAAYTKLVVDAVYLGTMVTYYRRLSVQR
ncbi:MAG: lipopolysaccharide biosynthesis protein [Gammaproteobacteria bacterium]